MPRPIACWLALAASLIAAVLPPAAVARTVCAETGRSAIGWAVHGQCALAATEDPPSCCDHDRPRRDAPGDGDDCCKGVPALTLTAPPDSGDDALHETVTAVWTPRVDTVPASPPALLVRAPCATGPPDHAARRHLRARRVDVLTV